MGFLKLAAFADLDDESIRLERATDTMSKCQKLVERVGCLGRLFRRLRTNAEDSESIAVQLKSVDAILGAVDNIKTAKAAWRSKERLGLIQVGLASVTSNMKAISDRMGFLDSAVAIDTDAVAEIAGKLVLLTLIQGKLLVNYSDLSGLEGRTGVLSPAVGMDVDGMVADMVKLERISALRDAHMACAESLSALKKGSSAVEVTIKKSGRDVVKLLNSASICPLSGGKLFDECKQLIGEAI